MYLCVRCIDFDSFYDFSVYLGTVMRVLYFFIFFYFYIKKIICQSKNKKYNRNYNLLVYWLCVLNVTFSRFHLNSSNSFIVGGKQYIRRK